MSYSQQNYDMGLREKITPKVTWADINSITDTVFDTNIKANSFIVLQFFVTVDAPNDFPTHPYFVTDQADGTFTVSFDIGNQPNVALKYTYLIL